jgi:hypothetical protein
MTIWTAVVGFSGTSKTPGIDATKRALSQIERIRRSKIDELRCVHEARVEAAKAARALWKKEVERAAEGKIVSLDEYRNTVTSEPMMPAAAADPGPFVAPRLYVSDVTIERLAVGLVKAGWLRKTTTLTDGRSKHRWEVNPKLSVSHAESAEGAETK